MRFESLHLKAFGGFTDHLIRFADEPHQFHIIHGANESGKSTSLRAITACCTDLILAPLTITCTRCRRCGLAERWSIN